MELRQAIETDTEKIAPLIARFRVELRSFKGITSQENVELAKEEFVEYLEANFPVFVSMDNENIVGYLVCRVDKPVVWVESIYVDKDYRRKGVASALFCKAEELALIYGEDTVYNYVHPNNDSMIRFLANRGYNVLNLIEVRKKHSGEKPETKILVGSHEFDY